MTGGMPLMFKRLALLLRFFFFFQAEDGIRDYKVTGVQTCALPISLMGVLMLVGFGAIVYAWYGVAKIIYVPLQFPRAVSGGIGGLALIGVGIALFELHVARKHHARETELTDDLLDEVAHLVTLAPAL